MNDIKARVRRRLNQLWKGVKFKIVGDNILFVSPYGIVYTAAPFNIVKAEKDLGLEPGEIKRQFPEENKIYDNEIIKNELFKKQYYRVVGNIIEGKYREREQAEQPQTTPKLIPEPKKAPISVSLREEVYNPKSTGVIVSQDAKINTPFLIRVKNALDRVLPKGSVIKSAYRSAEEQRVIIENNFKAAYRYFINSYDDKSVDGQYIYPSVYKLFIRNKWSLRDKVRLATFYRNIIKHNEGWKVALPGESKHQEGKAMDILGDVDKIEKILKRMKIIPVDGIRVHYILPEGSHIHAEFEEANDTVAYR